MASQTDPRIYLAWEIISEANCQGGYVFGGFVRDYLAGDSFNDIDIFIPGDANNSNVVQGILQQLLHKGMSVKSVANTPYYRDDLWRRNYSVISPNGRTVVSVDFVQRSNGNSMSVPFTLGTDADVNHLYMVGSTAKLWSGYPSTLAVVMQHITNREFEVAPTVSARRVQKMIMRGYKQIPFLSHVNKTSQTSMSYNTLGAGSKFNVNGDGSFSKNPLKGFIIKQWQVEVACKVCGRNVKVDEPQCWWCGVENPGRK